MAPNHNLNAVGTLPQRQEYTEELIDVGTYLELWDEFRVVADLVVCLLISISSFLFSPQFICSHSLTIFLMLIFAS
jgi:hypothetical protein